ncbi:MAG TPA: DUF6796 family protein [Candidatus Binatia bacterium]|jgi:hypothetical protein
MRSVAGMVATLAAALASVGDLLLLAIGDGLPPAYMTGGVLHPAMLVAAYYLGVLAIPLYALGYWHVARRLPLPYGRVVTALGVCGAIVGAVIHAVTGVAVAVLAATPAGSGGVAALQPFAAYLVPLWTIVAVATLVGSAAFAIPVLRGESPYPRWMALANPAVGMLVISACAVVAPNAAPLVVPASPNLAHVIFFALTASGRNPPPADETGEQRAG